MVCGRGGYVGAAPLPGGRWALAAALFDGAVRGAGAAGAVAGVLAESGLGAPALGRGALRGTGQLTRHRARIASGRVLVVGDASGYVQPLTGEGMSWAIACAARIGEHATRAAEGFDVAGEWEKECARVVRGRGLVCSSLCALASRPAVLAVALRAGASLALAGWASRRLCWRSA
jgi:hypothetical protein